MSTVVPQTNQRPGFDYRAHPWFLHTEMGEAWISHLFNKISYCGGLISSVYLALQHTFVYSSRSWCYQSLESKRSCESLYNLHQFVRCLYYCGINYAEKGLLLEISN